MAGGPGIHVPARHALEHDLQVRWERLLGREVGMYDRFFEIGGSSLLAARMLDEYERDTGMRIPLTALFVDDTIDALAKRVRDGSLGDHAAVVPLHARGGRLPFVFVHGDYVGGGFHSHTLAGLLGPDQPVYVVHPHGIDGGPVRRVEVADGRPGPRGAGLPPARAGPARRAGPEAHARHRIRSWASRASRRARQVER